MPPKTFKYLTFIVVGGSEVRIKSNGLLIVSKRLFKVRLAILIELDVIICIALAVVSICIGRMEVSELRTRCGD